MTESAPSRALAATPWVLLLIGHALAWGGASSFEHLSELGDQFRRIEAGEGWALLPMGPGGGGSGGSVVWVALAGLPWRLGLPPEGLAGLALALDATALAAWLALARRAWGPRIALLSALLLAADPTTERYLAENTAVLPALLAPLLPAWVLLQARRHVTAVGLAFGLALATSISAAALAPAAALGVLGVARRRWDLAAAAAAALVGLLPTLAGLGSEVDQASTAWTALTLGAAIRALAWPGLVLWAAAAVWSRRPLGEVDVLLWAAAALAFALGPAAPYLGCDPFHAAVGLPAFALLGARGAERFGLRAGRLAAALVVVQLATAAPRLAAELPDARGCPPGLPGELAEAASELLPTKGEVRFHGLYAHCLDGWWVWTGRHRGDAPPRDVVLGAADLLPEGVDLLGLRGALGRPAPPSLDTPTELRWPPGEGRLFVELAPGAEAATVTGGDVVSSVDCGACATAGHPALVVARRPDEELRIEVVGARDWSLESAVGLGR